jgi:hypothetical protein
MGPRARDVLALVTGDDVANDAFPFSHVREIDIGGHAVRALRVTYVGELGYELHLPIAALGSVYDRLIAAGQPHGIRPVGYRALESLRLEKGYRAWPADITPDDSPFEAGLGWAVKLKRKIDFLGRAVAERTAAAPLKKKLAGFTTDDPGVVLLGRETILRNGEVVGYLTSGGFGHTIGKPIGYGYVRNAAGVDDDYLLAGEMAAMMENKGQIFAHDVDGRRLSALIPRMDRAGIRNVQLRHPKENASLDDLSHRMDLVMIDAPCTGVGTWRRKPDAKWRVSEGALKKRMEDQAIILRTACNYVKPGGRLVYVTCSFLMEENEDQVASVLADRDDFIVDDAAESAVRSGQLTEAGAKLVRRCRRPEGSLRLTPRNAGCDGFFVAAMRRVG